MPRFPSLNSFISYLDYRNGKINREEMVSRIKKRASRAVSPVVLLGRFIPLSYPAESLTRCGLRGWSPLHVEFLTKDLVTASLVKFLELNRSILINMQLMHEGALYVGEGRQVQGKQMAAMVSVVTIFLRNT